MRFISLTLDLYKPLMHNNIKHFEINNAGRINILQAPNGFGKSSILREITPYPATSTDYMKKGKKVIVYTHNKSEYILTSDFSKVGCSHSFIKDGVELNISGATSVQNTLVTSMFNLNGLVMDLMSGVYKFCSMSRPERKDLIYKTYPSSLAFILEYYKNLESAQRNLNISIKNYLVDKKIHEDALISEETYLQYKDKQNELTTQINTLENEIYRITILINDLNSSFIPYKKILSDLTIDIIKEKIDDIKTKLNDLYTNHANDISDISCAKDNLLVIETELSHFIEQKDDLLKQSSDLRDYIDKQRDANNNDTEIAIKECLSGIELQQQIIKENDIQDNIPILNDYECTRLREVYPKLLEALEYVASSTTDKFWSEQEYQKAETDLNNKNCKHNELFKRYNELEAKHKDICEQADKYEEEYSYPSDCNRPCSIRIKLAKMKEELDKQANQIFQWREECLCQMSDLLKDTNALEKSLEEHNPYRSILKRLYDYFSSKSWCHFVCFNLNPLVALKQDITKINNNLLKLIRKSEQQKKLRIARDKLDTLNRQYIALNSTDKTVKKMITEALIDKEKQLEKVYDDIDGITTKINNYTNKKDILNKQISINDSLIKLQNTCKNYYDGYKLQCAIDIYKEIVRRYTDTKNKYSEELREIETIVKEQEKHITIIGEELSPKIRNMQDLRRKYELILAQLSPAAGIPYKYTIRYINAIFKIANELISKVWDYDIELEYVTENIVGDTFDFSFKLSINKDSEIKDISIASKGQQTIINLAITLAICIYRGYTHDFLLKLDEFTDGLSESHTNKLLNELNVLFESKKIAQVIMVNHDNSVVTSFNDACFITLTPDEILPSNSKIISTVA